MDELEWERFRKNQSSWLVIKMEIWSEYSSSQGKNSVVDTNNRPQIKRPIHITVIWVTHALYWFALCVVCVKMWGVFFLSLFKVLHLHVVIQIMLSSLHTVLRCCFCEYQQINIKKIIWAERESKGNGWKDWLKQKDRNQKGWIHFTLQLLKSKHCFLCLILILPLQRGENKPHKLLAAKKQDCRAKDIKIPKVPFLLLSRGDWNSEPDKLI